MCFGGNGLSEEWGSRCSGLVLVTGRLSFGRLSDGQVGVRRRGEDAQVRAHSLWCSVVWITDGTKVPASAELSVEDKMAAHLEECYLSFR